MKILLNYLSLVFISLFYLTSCSKKSADNPAPVPEGPGTISATIDGQTRTFNYDQDVNSTAKAFLATRYPNLYQLTVFGQEQPGYFRNDFSITLVSPDPIIPGTYHYDAALNTTNEIWYCPAVIPLMPCHTSDATGIVTITEINTLYVKGTFSAILSYTDNAGVARTNVVSNGKFNTLF